MSDFDYDWVWQLDLDEVTAELLEAAKQMKNMKEAGDGVNYQHAALFYRAARGRFAQLGGDIHAVFPPESAPPA